MVATGDDMTGIWVEAGSGGRLLTVNFCQPSHEFTFGVGII
jgi:hypothetical protein